MGRSWGGLWRRRRFIRADRNLYLIGRALVAGLVDSCAFRPVLLLLSATFSRITLLASAESYSGVLTPRMPKVSFSAIKLQSNATTTQLLPTCLCTRHTYTYKYFSAFPPITATTSSFANTFGTSSWFLLVLSHSTASASSGGKKG